MASAAAKAGSDLTEGPVFRTLLLFSIPIILTNLIQQLYGMVDLVIIGQFAGSTGTVGVSTGGEMADLVTPVAMGFSTAGQIYIAQLTGARETQRVRDTVGTLLSFMLLLSVVLLAAAVIFCDPILQLLNCPADALDQARAYLIITAAGYPFIFGYNAVCGILRGMGESKKPLMFIIVAATVNIFFDLLLVAVFDLQAAGTAIATVLSQLGSFGAALFCMIRMRDSLDFRMKPAYFRIRGDVLKVIIKLGIPQVARTMLVRAGMLWVNASVNAYGLTVSAVNSVGTKIQKFGEVFMQGVDTASAAMIGQNLGARKTERAGKVTWATLKLTMACAAVAALLFLLIPDKIFGIFTTDADVIELGIVFLRIMSIHFFASSFVGAFQAMVTGCGFVSLGFAIGVLDGLVCKIGLSLIFVNLLGMGYIGYFFGIACSRILPGLLCFAYFCSGRWKTRKLLSDDT